METAHKPPKCPKCGGNNLLIMETITATTSVKIINGAVSEGTYNNEYGNVLYVEGECLKCRHTWRFRKIGSMLGLFELKKYERL